MRLFLGVDGGQSGTTALIGDETGRVLGAGRAGPCNHASAEEGRRRLEAAVRGSVAAACEQAGLPIGVLFEAACFGMSGGPDDKRAILSNLLGVEHLVVTTDAMVALAGATATGQGIITISGTGSIALGRNTTGTVARAGGWGYVFGDEGSGFDIVRQAVRAALRMEEGWGPSTVLCESLCQAAQATSMNEVVHSFYTPDWPRDRVASLAPLVDSAAMAGDSVAAGILNGAATQLATLASSVRARLWAPSESVDAAFIGGVFQSRLVRERFCMLMELDSGVHCGPPQGTPAEGALREAYRAAGITLKILETSPPPKPAGCEDPSDPSG
jgi:N-acetylglucosamine kinase